MPVAKTKVEEKKEEVKPIVEPKDETVVFFSSAIGADFTQKKEQKFSDGSILEPAKSIKFEANCYRTDDLEEIEYLRNKIKAKDGSGALAGLVECKNEEQLMLLRAARISRRQGFGNMTVTEALEQDHDSAANIIEKHSTTLTGRA